MKVTLSEKKKKNLQGIKSGGDETENQINDLEHKKAKKKKKTNQWEQQVEKNPQNEACVRYLWYNFKWSNIHIIGVPEGDEKEQKIWNLFEKTVK